MMSDPNGLERQQKAESIFSFAFSKTRKCTKQENYIAEEPNQILYCTSTDGNNIKKVNNVLMPYTDYHNIAL